MIRLRTLLISIGALMIMVVYSFPLWQPLLDQRATSATNAAIPGLPPDLAEVFAILPPEQQAAYRAAAEVDPLRGLNMVVAALSPRQPAPEDEQELPPLVEPVILAVGSFGRVDAVRWGQGEAAIYASRSAPPLLRLENFSVANAPDLRLALVLRATDAAPVQQAPLPTEEALLPTEEAMMDAMEAGSADEMSALDADTILEIGVLKGVYGNQHYNLPANLDIRQYDHLVIYSDTLDMIYSTAPLFVRG